MKVLNRFVFLSFFIFSLVWAQLAVAQTNSNCLSADPFCTGTTYNFPAGVNAGTGQTGPDYGCLYSTPNPAWYYMQVANNGVITIYMSSTPQHDIDFICWGPFTSPTAPCVSQLTSANTVDCSYSTSWNETCDIPNAVSGQYYMLLITNYSNSACNIIFSQSGGTGTTNCGIVAPPITGDTVCVGESIHLTVTNPTPNATYSWTGPGGFTSTQMNPTIPNATPANAGTYSLVITVGIQVSPAVTTTVVVNPNPTITVANQLICQGGAALVTASGGSSYAWNTGSISNPLIVAPTATTTYTVTGTSTMGCSGTSSAVVTVKPNPTITINQPSICEGSTATLTASGAATYSWNNASVSNPLMVNPVSTTTYTVTGTDIQGCVGTGSATVTVFSPTVVSAADVSICRGQTASVIGSGGVSYLWSNGSTSNPLLVSPASTNSYSVTITNANGCTGTASAVVTVNLLPVVSSSVTNSYCGQNNGTASATGGTKYSWSNGDTTATITDVFAGTYTLSVSNGFCDTVVTVVVPADPKPEASFSALPQEMYLYDGDFIFTNTSKNSVLWEWSFGDGKETSSFNATHAYEQVGVYVVTLYVEDFHGCQDSTILLVEVKDSPGMYIPNSFTPNGDGKNDTWFPVTYLYDPEEYDLKIFDRWGKQMFGTTDINAKWNGTLNNNGGFSDVVTGVYVYRIIARQFQGKQKEYLGKIVIY